MPQGDKSSYTGKQKRQAKHIADSYKERGKGGKGGKAAEARAWATVNAMTGGGKKSGSGRGKKVNKAPAKKGGRKGGSSQSTAKRRSAGKKAAVVARRDFRGLGASPDVYTHLTVHPAGPARRGPSTAGRSSHATA